ncbi:MAG: hypothetical protein WCJ87_12255, partial [Burkholderiales bacterium]
FFPNPNPLMTQLSLPNRRALPRVQRRRPRLSPLQPVLPLPLREYRAGHPSSSSLLLRQLATTTL